MTPPPVRRSRFARFRRVASVAAAILFITWTVGQVARDITWATGLCFYIPSVCVALAMLVVAGLHVRARRRGALVAVGFALPPLAYVGLIENDFARTPPDIRGEFRLVHWNTAGRPGRPGIVEHLLAERADVYALTDVPNAAHVGVLHDRLGPGYQAATFENLAVVGRGTVRAEGWLVNRDGFEVQAVTSTPDVNPISLFVIDMPSDIRIARNPLLRELNELIERHRPDIVVGDFNAPRRSRALSDLPAGYRHAYHTSGGGWSASWPVPIPVFDLDHCLHGPRVVPLSYRFGGMNGDSDHRYQVFDFGLGE